jgi:hypothetical protein
MEMKTLMAGAAIVLVACASASAGSVRQLSAETADEIAKYQPSGEFATCLPVRQIDSMKFIEDGIILVETAGGTLYFNQTSNDCNGARANRRIEYTTSTPSLCRGEIIRVVDNSGGFMAGSCALGEFERVEKKAQG